MQHSACLMLGSWDHSPHCAATTDALQKPVRYTRPPYIRCLGYWKPGSDTAAQGVWPAAIFSIPCHVCLPSMACTEQTHPACTGPCAQLTLSGTG